MDEKGMEKTRLIAVENEFCNNWTSFHNLSQNNENIQSVEESEIVYAEHAIFYELVDSSPILHKIYTNILETFKNKNRKI